MRSSARTSQGEPSTPARRALEAFGFLVRGTGGLGIAVSGGSDSLALLILGRDYCSRTGIPCFAATVDHGLRPEAAAEAQQVARLCAALDVPHTTLHWRRDGAGPVSQEEARRGRHGLLAAWARRNTLQALALGHTRDDRLETFLMRARQGSGWYGLAGPAPEGCSPVWPEGQNARIIRPLLAFSRDELRSTLVARGIAWIEDPSNDALRFERVRMRRLSARMDPAARDRVVGIMDRLTVLRCAVMREARSLLSDVASGEHGLEIPFAARQRVGTEAWRRFIEAVVMAAGGAERAPRRDALDRLLIRLASGEPAVARGVTLGGAKIRIRNGGLLCITQAPPRRGIRLSAGDMGRARMLLDPPDLRSLSV